MFLRWFDRARDTEAGPSAGAAPGPSCCNPSLICLLLTLLLTAASTALLVAAVVSEHWEHVAWDRAGLQAAAARLQRNAAHSKYWKLELLLDGQVARLLRRRHRQADSNGASGGGGPSLFLIPMNGGIWTLCTSLNEEERTTLQRVGFSQHRCVNYLSPDTSRVLEARPHWQHRMQNLSISCALVCLIILGSSALVGTFGVLMHQISAILVTGVMYMLAATFALFTLTIIHFKRAHQPELLRSLSTRAVGGVGAGGGGGLGGDLAGVGVAGAHVAAVADGVLPSEDPGRLGPGLGLGLGIMPAPLWGDLLSARTLETAWSLQLGWGGAAATLVTATFWIALSKMMRYNPLNT